jgi:ribokinase
MVGAVGDDAAGDDAIAMWNKHGVSTEHVARLTDCGTGLGLILVDASGQNSIVVDSAANARVTPAQADAAAALIAASKLVVGQLEIPTEATLRAFQIARDAGVATMLNAAPAPELIDAALLAATDILVVNEIEGQMLSGHDHPAAIGEALLGKVGRAVVITLGAEGAFLFEHQRPPHSLPAHPVSAVDTTGAGDAFTGAFAARWIATGDARAALAWGVAAGSIACTARGAMVSYGDAAAVAALVA